MRAIRSRRCNDRSGTLRRWLCVTAATALAASAGTPAWAKTDQLLLAGEPAMSAAQLGDERGGFLIGGFDISFGFSVETAVDNAFAVVSSFNVTSPGEVVNVGTLVRGIIDPALATAAGATGAATSVSNTDSHTAGIGGQVDAALSAALGAAEIPGAAPSSAPAAPASPPTSHPPSPAVSPTAASAASGTIPLQVPAPTTGLVAANIAPALVEAVLAASSGGAGSPSAISVGDAATTQVIHDALNGHLAVINNRLNDVTIQQSVVLNFTVGNFSAVANASRQLRNVSGIVRHIGNFSRIR